jgi:two-component system, OmpR family, sensor histidine kinase KdpD
MTRREGRGGIPAPYALPAAFAALFLLGTLTAALNGRLPASGVLVLTAVITGATALLAEPLAALPLGVVGWLTVIGFSRPPYADLRPTGTLATDAAITLAATVVGAALAGMVFRPVARRFTLEDVNVRADEGQPDLEGLAGQPRPVDQPGRWRRRAAWTGAINTRRRVAGVALALIGLPLLTTLLVAANDHLNFADDLLLFLLAVVTVTVIGGFWPAVLAAVAACLLLNWYLTPPLHTFTIGEPRNLLALVLFVTVAVAVSSVVHLAARLAVQAAVSREETTSLLDLARTVLGGADTPTAVLDHLTGTLGGRAELQELTADRWVRVAVSGGAEAGTVAATEGTRIHPRPGLALLTSGQTSPATTAQLAGFGAQVAAALDRERLRMQASQAEALAEGNRIRTALLAAVSHDLRTPLASIKASVSSLRQTDVDWSPADEADLLATIEQNADRLDALIGNLLDLSRLHTGSLDPFLRPTAIEEVAPVALRGLDAPGEVEIVVPEGVPLVRADPGLLERVLANIFSNALRHSPPTQLPVLRARPHGETVLLEVVDHGPGVPDDELKQRIFEPFQRFDDRNAGVGLGLAVAKGFAEAMGGSIAAVDTPGGGLTIRVALPVAHSEDRSVLGAGQ